MPNYVRFQSDLPGFYDPCIGEDKFLRIEYKYRNNIYNVTIPDTEALKIPNTGTENIISKVISVHLSFFICRRCTFMNALKIKLFSAKLSDLKE